MTEDERVVRAAWKSVNWGASNYGGTEFGVVVYDDEHGTGFKAKTQAEAWQAAREFTKARQEEVRLLDGEIALMRYVISDRGRKEGGHAARRILGRLQGIRDDLRKGMK